MIAQKTCAGLEPRHRQRRIAQLRRQPLRRVLANPPAFEALLAAEQRAAEERPGAQHDGLAFDRGSVREPQPADPIAAQDQLRRLASNDIDLILLAQDALHRGLE